MSKVREIEFWVEPDDIENLTNRYDSSSVLRLYVHRDSVSKNGQLVKLLQEIPEKKISISESELDKVIRSMNQVRYSGTDGLYVNEAILKQKLFGKGGVE